jgi:hypothetical protein
MPDRLLVDATPGETPTHEVVQQLVEAEAGEGTQGIARKWLASDSALVVLTSDATGVKISPNNGTTPPASVVVAGSAAGGVLSGTFPNPGFASAPTFVGPVTVNGALQVNGTLTATGTTSLQGTSVTTLGASSNVTVGGTLGVTGLTTVATLNVNGDLHLSGAATLGNDAFDPIQIPGTLLVVSAAEFRGDLVHKGNFWGMFNQAPSGRQTVAGSRAGNAALNSLCSALANYGVIINNTTA